jgi:hypothetical protein
MRHRLPTLDAGTHQLAGEARIRPKLVAKAGYHVILLLVGDECRESGVGVKKYVHQSHEKREFLDRDSAPLDLVVELMLVPNPLHGTLKLKGICDSH